MGVRVAALTVVIPLAVVVALLAVPGLDRVWMASAFHFYVVPAASLLAAAVCLVLVVSARSIRQTRVLFLALSFFSLALLFSVHGLTTPGHLYEHVSAALTRSPYLSTLTAGVFAALSVVRIPRFMERTGLRLAEVIFGGVAALTAVYFGTSLAFPDWLTGFPTTEEWFRYLLTALIMGMLVFAAWRYLESYLFARLPGQLAVVVGLLVLAESQLALGLGRPYFLSWWMYHALFLVAFGSVLVGWGWEAVRARDVRAIAEGLVMRDALVQLKRGRPNTLVALAEQIENHDPATYRHVDRVANYAYAIGQEMGLSAARLRTLVLAAQLHDIGKIGLPGHVLSKPGKLTEEEWGLIKEHPSKGWEIMRRADSEETLAGIIRHHHERFDGAGYPDGLRGESIPLDARIIAVADTFDALTSERPYRTAFSPAAAKAELRRVAGTQLDPACVAALLGALKTSGQPARQEEPAPLQPVEPA